MDDQTARTGDPAPTTDGPSSQPPAATGAPDPLPPAPDGTTPAPWASVDAAASGPPGVPAPAVPPVDPAAPSDPWLVASGQTASGRSPRSLLIGAGLVLGIIALTVLVGTILLKGSTNDSYEAIAEDVGNQILAEPGFKAKYGTVTSSEQAFALGQQVARQGLSHLGDADLVRYWSATNKMLQGTSDTICGRLLRQTATADDALAASKSVDTATFRELADVLLLAIRADLRGDAAVPPPSTQQVSAAMVALQAAMGPAMLQSANTLADTTATDAETCAAGRTFLAAVMALPEPDRSTILRFMIASI